MTHDRRSRVVIQSPGKPGLYQPLPLQGWDVLGVVTAGDHTGALIRNHRTGIYCMANAGTLRSLPQRKVIAALEAAHA